MSQIVGIAKELMVIGFGILIFHDSFTFLNGVGFSICICGILIYKLDRIWNFNYVEKTHEEQLLLEEVLSEEEEIVQNNEKENID
jgi:hypothetical protein